MIEKLLEQILIEKKTLRDYTRDTVKMFDNHLLLINLNEIENEMNIDNDDEHISSKKDVKRYMNIMLLILISIFMINFYNGLKKEENRYFNYIKDEEKISDLESDNIPEEINQKFKDNNIDDYKRLVGMIEYMINDSSIDKKYIYEELKNKMQNDDKFKSLIKNQYYSKNEMMTFIAIFINNFIEENK